MYTTLDNGVTWSERQKLLASDGAAGDLFGYVVSLYSNKLAVSAYADDTEKGVDSGEICY